jgi:hypothetical protein
VLVIDAHGEGTAANSRGSPCSIHGNGALRF